MKILSVVCARNGSKGLKNKCTARIKNKMLIEYSIEYSISLGDNVKTVVSTDIPAVIDYCRKNNIDHIKRNPKLCKDDTKIDDVLVDAIEKRGQDCCYCNLVYGNIPTRYRGMFEKALRFLEKNKSYDAVISMQDVGKFHPAWLFDYNKKIIPKISGEGYRRQELSPKMIHDGHTLLFRSMGFLKRFKGEVSYDSEYRYSIFGNKIKPLINSKLVIDVDTQKDLNIARAIMLKNESKYRTN